MLENFFNYIDFYNFPRWLVIIDFPQILCWNENGFLSEQSFNQPAAWKHESWIMSASWVSYWRHCMTSLLILRLSPNKIMSFKSNNERKAGSLNPLVCSVSSSAHMTDLHLSCQSVATLHALPQIWNRLPQSPQAREKKSFSKKSCPCLTLAQGCGPTSGCPGGMKTSQGAGLSAGGTER